MDKAVPQLILLIILLVFYCLGPFIVLIALLTHIGPGGDINSDWLTKLLGTLATNPGAYTSVIHQMIVPVVAAVTAANYKNIIQTRGQTWLFLLPLITIFVCLAVALFVSTTPDSFASADNKTQNAGAISQLFLSSASTLSVYVMLLVGLKVGAN